MNCDPLARPYQALEYVAFRKTLQKQRFAFLHEADCASRALILGEGDGRFLCELASRNSAVAIDCIEASAKMIEIAQRRLRNAHVPVPERIRFLHRSAIAGIGSGPIYDLIVSHFFLDCFSEKEAQTLVHSVRDVCLPGAKWLIAEFHEPETGWRKWHARCWLTTMYLFFACTTGLEISKLPPYRTHLETAGFTLQGRTLAYAQMVTSEVWQRPFSTR